MANTSVPGFEFGRILNPSTKSRGNPMTELHCCMISKRFHDVVLIAMKLVKKKNPALHKKAEKILAECKERNKNNEAGYESLTGAMRANLLPVIDEDTWNRADIVEQKKAGKRPSFNRKSDKEHEKQGKVEQQERQ